MASNFAKDTFVDTQGLKYLSKKSFETTVELKELSFAVVAKTSISLFLACDNSGSFTEQALNNKVITKISNICLYDLLIFILCII